MPTRRHPFFLPYQERWIRDESRLKIMEKSRQIGMTWATAYRLVRRHADRRQRLDSWVASRDEISAKLFLEDCKSFRDILHTAAQDFGHTLRSDEGRDSSYSLRFRNRTQIHSLSSNPDTQAGKRGTRVLDEFALHPQAEQLYSTALPGITWGGQLEILSTHRDAEHLFNRLIQEVLHNGNPKQFSYHRVTLEDALEQGLLPRIQEKLPAEDLRRAMTEADYYEHVRQSCIDEDSFRQEYLCCPFQEGNSFLPLPLIRDCEYADGEAWEYGPSAITQDCYLGIDIGREHDLSVFWLLEKEKGIAHTRQILCAQRMRFSEQEALLKSFFTHPSLRRVCIDQSGIGRQFTERAIEHFGSYRVEGITFTSAIKERLAYELRRGFEQRQLRIPAERSIRDDLRSVKRETTFAGNIRFSAERNKNGHADRFWALALAWHAGQSPTAASFSHFTPIPWHQSRHSWRGSL
ncbi:MAG: terminase family protein [Puniceicoccales bacterium]|jgi:phage FluMu gp28-like protein|nr:terminase family protein [Puniceicoccales bacterium]